MTAAATYHATPADMPDEAGDGRRAQTTTTVGSLAGLRGDVGGRQPEPTAAASHLEHHMTASPHLDPHEIHDRARQQYARAEQELALACAGLAAHLLHQLLPAACYAVLAGAESPGDANRTDFQLATFRDACGQVLWQCDIDVNRFAAINHTRPHADTFTRIGQLFAAAGQLRDSYWDHCAEGDCPGDTWPIDTEFENELFADRGLFLVTVARCVTDTQTPASSTGPGPA